MAGAHQKTSLPLPLISLGTCGLNTHSPDTTPSPPGAAPILLQPCSFVGGGAARQSAVVAAGKNKSGASDPYVLVGVGEPMDPPLPSVVARVRCARLVFFFVVVVVVV